MKNKYILWIVIAVIIIGGGIGLAIWYDSKPGQHDAFAQCLKDEGVTYYGAFWCPNCQKQNAMFGKSKEFVPYIECSTPDGKGQVELCKDAGIEAYPTWEFPGGERVTGVQPLEVLAEKSGCTL
jgi:thiol-disulfide isomerase/thioredoxin